MNACIESLFWDLKELSWVNLLRQKNCQKKIFFSFNINFMRKFLIFFKNWPFSAFRWMAGKAEWTKKKVNYRVLKPINAFFLNLWPKNDFWPKFIKMKNHFFRRKKTFKVIFGYEFFEVFVFGKNPIFFSAKIV